MPHSNISRHVLSSAGLFTAVIMLTGTSPNQTVYQYQCGASARLADNFILVPEAPALFFSVDLPLNVEKVAEYESAMNEQEEEPLISTQWEEATFVLAGRYMTGNADPDEPNENITLTMSKWQSVPEDLCEDEDGSTDTGSQSDTGAEVDTGTEEEGLQDDSFQFSWVDGECYGWNEFQSIPLAAIADENSAAFEFTATIEDPWGSDVILRLALEGNGHASIDFNFTHTLYEMEEFESSSPGPGFGCGRADDTPARSDTRDAELCAMLDVDVWNWTEEDDPSP